MSPPARSPARWPGVTARRSSSPSPASSPKEIGPGTQVHVNLDNVSSHRPAEVNEWQKDNGNWTFRFTPTSASWMNAVEGFFTKLSRQRLKHAIFNSFDECIAAIKGCTEHHNTSDARPFRRSKEPEVLVEA